MTIPGWPHQHRLACLPDNATGRPYDHDGHKGVRAAIAAVGALTALDAVNTWRHRYYHQRDPLPQYGQDWRDDADKRELLTSGRDLLAALAASSVLPKHMYEAVTAGSMGEELPDALGDTVCRTAHGVAALIREQCGGYLTDLFIALDAAYAGGWHRWGPGGRPCGICGGARHDDKADAGHQSWCNRTALVNRYLVELWAERERS